MGYRCVAGFTEAATLTQNQQRIPAKTVLFRSGDSCKGFVVLHEGSIRVTLTAPNGREVVLYRVAPGDVCLQTFSCLIEDRHSSAEGVAESELVAEVIPAAQFYQRIAIDTEFRDRIFKAVARRFAELESLVENVALSALGIRLARVLLRLSKHHPEVDATHDQLARETASGRAAVSRQLAAFAETGLVKLERGRVTIADRDGLEALAGSSN